MLTKEISLSNLCLFITVDCTLFSYVHMFIYLSMYVCVSVGGGGDLCVFVDDCLFSSFSPLTL